MKSLLELAIENKWDEVIARLYKESPVVSDDFMRDFFSAKKDATYPYEKWTDKQKESFRELSDPDYRTKYYMSKKDNLTDREWEDFRKCNI